MRNSPNNTSLCATLCAALCATLAACGGAQAPQGADDTAATRQAASNGRADSGGTITALAAPAAFPGAQGAGAATPGGRGGTVYIVNSLADAGPGTLRGCVEDTPGPRTCVFTVGGTIALQSTLYVTEPFLTVAGQSAPGGGIQLTPAPGAVLSSLVLLSTHDVIWQYTRLRHSWRAACANAATSECGALLVAESRAYNVIADHNSLSWNQDEGYGVWRGGAGAVHHITLSMSLIAEGLASHSTGAIVGASTSALNAEVTDIDFHHNLVMNNNHRNPLLKNRSARVVNNIFYNQRFYASQVGGGGEFDIVGNYYKAGPMTSGSFFEVQAFSSSGADALDGSPSIYLAGNFGWHNPEGQGDPWLLTQRVSGENGTQTGAVPLAWRRSTPLAPTAFPITVEPAKRIAQERGSIVPTVGASRRVGCDGNWVRTRDVVDRRLIDQYLFNTGIGALPVTEADVGGIPAVEPGTPCADADQDGLPDLWEQRKFGNLSQGPNGLFGTAGYTNLEAYLHGL